MVEVMQSSERFVEIGNIKVTTPTPDKDYCHIKLNKPSYDTLIVNYADVPDLIEALRTIKQWRENVDTSIKEK